MGAVLYTWHQNSWAEQFWPLDLNFFLYHYGTRNDHRTTYLNPETPGKNVPQVMYKRQFLEKILSNGLKSNCIIKLPYSKCDCMHLCDLFYAKFINSFYALSLSHVSWTNSGINVLFIFYCPRTYFKQK